MDFEAHTISDTDFNGIKKLLQQVNMWLRNTRLNDISAVINIYQNLYIVKKIYYLTIVMTLFLQLFLKAHVNISELTDVIIQQNHIGSVIRVRH